MEFLLEKVISEKEFKWNFEIKEDGIYGIEITASVKSWRQNLFSSNFFKDDDLTVKIDDSEFLKKSGKKGLFDGEIAWNGNNLKGLKKTNLFLIELNQGNHTLTFLADQKPKIETIKIYKLKEEEIIYLPKDNYPIQEGNQRQWLTIIFCNLGLKFLKIKASAKLGKGFLFFKKDDSDLKLIINGEIQKNQEPKSHKHWYWCGRTLKGNLKIFEKELNLKPDLHYLELWADRSPEVEEIKLKILETEIYPIFILDDIQAYTYKGILGNENYNRFDKEILEVVNFWNKVFFFQKYPPEKALDPNLVKAITYRESRMGYESIGEVDVMQVGDPDNPALFSLKNIAGYPANEFISKNKAGHLSYNFPKERLPVKVESPEESIFWGVRWLYNKAQIYYGTGEKNLDPLFVREWKTWEQAIIDYNGSNKKYEYQKKVWKIYKDGIDPDDNILWEKISNGFSLIKTLGLISLFLIIFLAGLFCGLKIGVHNQYIKNIDIPYYHGYTNETDEPVKKLFLKNLEEYKKNKNYYGEVFRETVKMCEKVRCYMEIVVVNYYDDLVNNMKSNKQFLEAMQVFDFIKNIPTGERNIHEGDIDNDGENEIIFIRRDVLNQSYIVITIIDKIDNKFKIIEHKIIDGYDGYLKLLDVTNDLQPEILLFMSQGRGGYPLYIYQYLEDKKLRQIFDSEFSLFPKYTFSDIDNDGLMEIKMQGELKDAVKDYHAQIEIIYEYNQKENDFVKIKGIKKKLE
ncbi:MAG: hypothetical protein Q7T79_00340 [bacterium]|nr:hypothetical protein [bacterium]